MRTFGLVLLFPSIALMFFLVGEVVGTAHWLPVSALTLLYFLLPGTIVRFVMVANATMEIPLTLAFTWALWRAWKRDSARALLVAGGLFGLSLLTKLTLAPLAFPLVVTAGLLVHRRRGRPAAALGLAAVALALPVVLLAPWLSFNRTHYHAWTANKLARTIQAPALNPTNAPFTWDKIRASVPAQIERIPTPQEWRTEPEATTPRLLRGALITLLVIVPVGLSVAALARRRGREFDAAELVILVAPLPLTVLFLAVESNIERWDLILSRYFLFTVAPFVLFGALQWRNALGEGKRWLGLVAAVALPTLGLWAVLAPRIP